jgi:hypothetical protein
MGWNLCQVSFFPKEQNADSLFLCHVAVWAPLRSANEVQAGSSSHSSIGDRRGNATYRERAHLSDHASCIVGNTGTSTESPGIRSQGSTARISGAHARSLSSSPFSRARTAFDSSLSRRPEGTPCSSWICRWCREARRSGFYFDGLPTT